MRGSGAVLFARRELRRRVADFVGLAIIVAVGVGVTIGALVAAYRTDRVYDAYVRDSQVTDLVINPTLPTDAAAEAIRRLPGVRTVHSDALLTASIQVRKPAPLRDVLDADQSLQVRGSTDGRYEAVDRPVITDGRFASGPREVFVSNDYRSDLERILGHPVKVGDTLPVTFWWGFLGDASIGLDTNVRPIDTEPLRVAGFGTLSDEVLPDELYPRQRLIVSADIARRYSCRADLRSDMTEEQAVSTVFPDDCARSYQYFAVQLEDRPGNRSAVRKGFARAADQLMQDVPRTLREQGIAYSYISQDRTDVDRAVHRVTRPTVTALGTFGLVAGVATLTTTALAIARILRRSDSDQHTLHALGAGRGTRALSGALTPTLAVTAGIAGALVIGFVASIVGPAGSVRGVAPSAGLALPARVALPTAAIMLVALIGITWLLALRARAPSELGDRPSGTSVVGHPRVREPRPTGHRARGQRGVVNKPVEWVRRTARGLRRRARGDRGGRRVRDQPERAGR